MSNELRFNQEYISYKPKEQKVFPIQEHDWNKLKTITVECGINSNRIFKDIGLLLIGAGISAFLSLIALYNSKEVDSWILNANWIMLICAFVIGIVLLFLDKEQNNKQNKNIESIIDEMKYIESKYYIPPTSDDPVDKKEKKYVRAY